MTTLYPRSPAVILGRVIGDSDGWDQSDEWTLVILDVRPSENPLQLPCGDWQVDYDCGFIVANETKISMHDESFRNWLATCPKWEPDNG